MRPHTTGAPYRLQRWHRRTYPRLPKRAPQGRCAGQPAALLRPRCGLGLGQRPGSVLLRLHPVPALCYNEELKTDIPLLLRFTSAKRHDSVSFLASFHELEKHMPSVSIENICLDSAMDNYFTYRLLKKGGYGLSSTSMTNMSTLKRFLMPSPSTGTARPYAGKSCS